MALETYDQDLCRSALERQLAMAAQGAHTLIVPGVRGLMRAGEGQHFHHAPETFLQISGHTDFDLPYERFRLQPDAVCLMPIRMPHREVHHSTLGVFRQIVFMFEDSGFAWHLKEGTRPGSSQASQVFPLHVRQSPEIRQAILYLGAIHAAHLSAAAQKERTVQGLLLAYLALLHRVLLEPASEVTGQSQRIQECRHLVLRGLADPRLGVRGLARRLGCSANHLSTRFAAETGITLAGYIQHERITAAQALLEDPSLCIKEIAIAVGMGDASYFGRVFKARLGMTPRTYRARTWPTPS